MLAKVKSWLTLFRQVKKIYDSEADWLIKYELIFSAELAGAMRSLFKVDWEGEWSCQNKNVSFFYAKEESQCKTDLEAFYKAMEDRADQFYKVLDITPDMML